jgi:hypothetical protein
MHVFSEREVLGFSVENGLFKVKSGKGVGNRSSEESVKVISGYTKDGFGAIEGNQVGQAE